jgi:hypothetical protein
MTNCLVGLHEVQMGENVGEIRCLAQGRCAINVSCCHFVDRQGNQSSEMFTDLLKVWACSVQGTERIAHTDAGMWL